MLCGKIELFDPHFGMVTGASQISALLALPAFRYPNRVRPLCSSDMTPRAALLTALLCSVSLSVSRAQTPEPQPAAQPSKVFPHLGKHLVLINGAGGQGSGSIMLIDGQPLLVTNAHVLSGNSQVTFSRVDGTAIKVEKFGVAQQADLATFTQTTATGGLEIMKNVAAGANIGDKVVVLGNSQGLNVITEISGRIVGIGPNDVEVDARFVAGNSGSPIIHVKSGKVIAVATLVRWGMVDRTVRDSQFAVGRRFGTRIDTVKTWENPAWAAFQQEAQVVNGVHKQSQGLYRIYQDSAEGNLPVAEIFEGTNRLRRPLVDYLQIVTRPNMAVSTKQEARSRFYRTLIFECGFDLPNLHPEKFGDYHATRLRKEMKMREDLKSAFQKFATGLTAVDRIVTP
jgi:hypothetical protein